MIKHSGILSNFNMFFLALLFLWFRFGVNFNPLSSSFIHLTGNDYD